MIAKFKIIVRSWRGRASQFVLGTLKRLEYRPLSGS